MTPAKIKFLISLGNLIKTGAVKNIKQAMDFAKQQFGKIDQSFIDDIVNVFKKEGKTKKGDVVPIKKKETKDIRQTIDEKEGDDFIDFIRKQGDEEGANKVQKEVDRLNKAIEDADKRVAAKEALEKRTADIKKGDVEGEGIESLGTSIKKIKETAEELKKSTPTPESMFDDLIRGQQIMIKLRREGQVRTAVRFFMRQEEEAGRLKLRENDSKALREYSGTADEYDPINIFRRYYGEDALGAADDVADVFNRGESFDHYAQLLRENVDSKILTPKTKGLGDYDQSVIDAERIVKEAEKDAKNLEILEKFDPTDRTKNADGGLIDILKL